MIDKFTDWWRRVVPGHPRISRTAFYASHGDLPPQLPRHQLALVGGTEDSPKWAAFECPCGVGHRVAVPLSNRRPSSWSLTVDARGRPSLRPSIDSNDGERCHFWLRDGKIYWAPDRRSGRRGVPLTRPTTSRR
jgi:hypothetical protein